MFLYFFVFWEELTVHAFYFHGFCVISKKFKQHKVFLTNHVKNILQCNFSSSETVYNFDGKGCQKTSKISCHY